MENAKIGRLVWFDLTIENAAEISAFYKAVVGWEK